jgi:hypothetical protein
MSILPTSGVIVSAAGAPLAQTGGADRARMIAMPTAVARGSFRPDTRRSTKSTLPPRALRKPQPTATQSRPQTIRPILRRMATTST